LPDPMVVTIQLTGDMVEVECPGGSMDTVLGLPPALIARADGVAGRTTIMVDWIGNVWMSGMDDDHPQVLHRARRQDVTRMVGEPDGLIEAISQKVAEGRGRREEA
jgi:hypothetical protein